MVLGLPTEAHVLVIGPNALVSGVARALRTFTLRSGPYPPSPTHRSSSPIFGPQELSSCYSAPPHVGPSSGFKVVVFTPPPSKGFSETLSHPTLIYSLT